LSSHPALAIGGLSLAAFGFVAAQPVFWTLPTEYMTGYAAAAGIALINSLGNLGGFLAPIMRNAFASSLGANAGTYSLAGGAILAAILFALTGVFRRANTIESGDAETLRRVD
jgi:hypothetical protein